MRQRQIRLEDYDDARLQARAELASVSAPQWIKSVVLRELNAIDSAAVLREEFEREIASMRAQNDRFEISLLEIVVALRDSLLGSLDHHQAQTVQAHKELLDGFREAIKGKSGGGYERSR